MNKNINNNNKRESIKLQRHGYYLNFQDLKNNNMNKIQFVYKTLLLLTSFEKFIRLHNEI